MITLLVYSDSSCMGVALCYRMMWAAGVLASVSSITYPAISAFVSMHSDADKQGLVQGMVTGMRGLCNGLGPAMFGLIFYLFHVDLNEDSTKLRESRGPASSVHGDNNTAGQIFESMQPNIDRGTHWGDLETSEWFHHGVLYLELLTLSPAVSYRVMQRSHTHMVDIDNHNSTGELDHEDGKSVFDILLQYHELLFQEHRPTTNPRHTHNRCNPRCWWQCLYPMGPRPWGPAYAPPPLEDSQVCQWRYTTRLSVLRNTTGSVRWPLWWTTQPCSSAPTTVGPTCF
uniref:Uncharacterized protein n=1 Tax=Timema monikensis TaxID=170555 RepID=A0A7R9EE28_9NEOP|nr:unnamed protein product [Timema monikensis]